MCSEYNSTTETKKQAQRLRRQACTSRQRSSPMSTATSLSLSSAAAAIGVKNRLSRDLDELKRAAAGAGTLPIDDAGNLFDLSVSLHQAVQALTAAISDCDRYIAATRPAPKGGFAGYNGGPLVNPL